VFWLKDHLPPKETIAWLLWYNRTRIHSTLNDVSPLQLEQDWAAAMDEDRRLKVRGD